ncbi:hypothetical protein [Tautonia plasticadhaerens]|uniref:DoxX n=1 Tax=Tautonia plasticadhaerens TaxID=2527974 RepID=A0A518H485_9BACT|nr:hypothetical protein [Tautonia plasticadhaerens]QDV35664.1 hypothetical protein ElP_35680 [Tautonia plasticadhaerens]
MVFGRRTFRIAGIYGLLLLLPMYLLEGRIGRDFPPPITHPEHFYGFLGVAAAWQVAFLVIAGDPVRFRPLMPVAVLEKASFGLAAVALWLGGRIPAPVLAPGLIDLALGVLFVVAYLRTPQAAAAMGRSEENPPSPA